MAEGEYNVLSAAAIAKLRQRTQGQAAPVIQQERRALPPQEFSQRRAVILVNNESEDVPAGGCLAIMETFQSGYGPIFLKCRKPSTTFCRAHTFAPLTGLKANGEAPAQDGPDYYALYNSGSPANGGGFGPTPGFYYLTENYPQTSICHGIWDATAKIMLATLGPIEILIGKLAGSLSQGGNATMNVWAGAPGSEAVISSMTLTVYDWLMKSGATAIASGKKVVARNINGNWYVIEAECA